jgi:hypothetical protein
LRFEHAEHASQIKSDFGFCKRGKSVENRMQTGVHHESTHLSIRANVARFDIVEDRAFAVLQQNSSEARSLQKLTESMPRGKTAVWTLMIL